MKKTYLRVVPAVAAVPSYGRKGIKGDYKVSKIDSVSKKIGVHQEATRRTKHGAPAVSSQAGSKAKGGATVSKGKLASMAGKVAARPAATAKMVSSTVKKMSPDTQRKMNRAMLMGGMK